MKTVLITGANRGIGLEMVRQYWSDGWRVIACCRTIDAQLDKDRMIHVKLDVTDVAQIKKLAAQLEKESIDILINNAGIRGPSNEELDLLSPSPWLKTLHVNTVGPFMIARTLLTQIEKSHLKIIANISSAYGSIQLNNRRDCWVYRASKAALNAVTKCLAIDLQGKGIAVVSIHPGSVRTDMNPDGKITPSESVQGIKKVLHSVSLKDSGSFLNYKHELLPW